MTSPPKRIMRTPKPDAKLRSHYAACLINPQFLVPTRSLCAELNGVLPMFYRGRYSKNSFKCTSELAQQVLHLFSYMKAVSSWACPQCSLLVLTLEELPWARIPGKWLRMELMQVSERSGKLAF